MREILNIFYRLVNFAMQTFLQPKLPAEKKVHQFSFIVNRKLFKTIIAND
jgi:hypothetical protein